MTARKPDFVFFPCRRPESPVGSVLSEHEDVREVATLWIHSHVAFDRASPNDAPELVFMGSDDEKTWTLIDGPRDLSRDASTMRRVDLGDAAFLRAELRLDGCDQGATMAPQVVGYSEPNPT